jgi:hypothetical protein
MSPSKIATCRGVQRWRPARCCCKDGCGCIDGAQMTTTAGLERGLGRQARWSAREALERASSSLYQYLFIVPS